jgi:hypothetical protein
LLSDSGAHSDSPWPSVSASRSRILTEDLAATPAAGPVLLPSPEVPPGQQILTLRAAPSRPPESPRSDKHDRQTRGQDADDHSPVHGWRLSGKAVVHSTRSMPGIGTAIQDLLFLRRVPTAPVRRRTRGCGRRWTGCWRRGNPCRGVFPQPAASMRPALIAAQGATHPSAGRRSLVLQAFGTTVIVSQGGYGSRAWATGPRPFPPPGRRPRRRRR